LKRVVVDAGSLIGWLTEDDKHHTRSRQFFAGFCGQLITTWPVVGEVCALLPEHLIAPFLRWVGRGGVTVVDVPVSALGKMADNMDKYASLPMDLADASLIWLAEQVGVLDVATVDRRDFGVYRTAQGAAFNNVLFEDPPSASAAAELKPRRTTRRSSKPVARTRR
jgi:uncharacterized protein